MRHIYGAASLLTQGATLLGSGRPLIAKPIPMTTVEECKAFLASLGATGQQNHRLGHSPLGKPDQLGDSRKNTLRCFRIDFKAHNSWYQGRGLTLEELLARCNQMVVDHRAIQIKSRQQPPQEVSKIIKAAQARMEAAGIRLTKPRKPSAGFPTAKRELIEAHPLAALVNEPEMPKVNLETPAIEMDLDRDLDVYLRFEVEDPGDLEMVGRESEINVADMAAIRKRAKAEDAEVEALREQLDSPYSWDGESRHDLIRRIAQHMEESRAWWQLCL